MQKALQVVDAIEPAMQEFAVPRMQQHNFRVMLAAEFEHLIDQAPFGALAEGHGGRDGHRADVAIHRDGGGSAAGVDGPLEKKAGGMHPIVDRAVKDSSVDPLWQVITTTKGPFPVVVDGGSLVQSEIWDVQAGMIGSVDSIFGATSGVPGDILGDYEIEIIVMARRVDALVLEDEGERR